MKQDLARCPATRRRPERQVAPLRAAREGMKFSPRTLMLFVVLTFLVAATYARASAGQDAAAQTFVPGQTIERELRGGESHAYTVQLGAGQFIRIVAEQKGINVTLALHAADGRAIIRLDDADDAHAGQERLVLAVEAAGGYRVEVKSEHKWAPPGAYVMRFVESRAATDDDRARSANEVKSLALMREGRELLEEATDTSRKRSAEKYTEALPLIRALGDRPTREAAVLVGLGASYGERGETEPAFEYIGQALALYRASKDRWGEADALNNLGSLYYLASDLEKSFASHSQALPLARAAGDVFLESEILNNIGTVHRMAGRAQLALDTHREVLPLREAIGDRDLVATTNNNIGAVYFSLGEWQKAGEYMGRALEDWQAVNNRPKVNIALSNLGAVHLRLGEKEKALELLQKSLTLSREIGDRRGEGQALSNIAGIYSSLRDYQRAAEYAERSIPIRRAIDDMRGVGISMQEAGVAYDGLGNQEKALEYFSEALTLRRSTGDRNGEAGTLYRIAGVERVRGRLTEARARIEESLAIVESLRANINSQQLRAAFFATVQSYYDFYIDLLMQMHEREPAGAHAAEALAASERARARSLLDLMQEARIDVRSDADPALVEREAAVRAQLNKAAARQARLQGSKADAAQLASAAREVETLTTELTEVQSRLRQSSPRYAALAHPRPLELREIQGMLDAETVLLEYKLGEKRSFLWLVTQDEVLSYALPPRAEINARARQAYAALTAHTLPAKPGESLAAVRSRRRDAADPYWRLAGKLGEMILAPAAPRLGKKRLLIVAEGSLQYIPFGALPAPSSAGARPATPEPRPLIAEREVVNLPSASVLAELRREAAGRKPAEKAVAVFADPVFESDDPRIKSIAGKGGQGKGVQGSSAQPAAAGRTAELSRAANEVGLTRDAASGIPRLIATRQEADAILSAAPRSASMRAFDFEASRTTARSPELARYRFIHFATHGLLNAEHPELSGLVLSLVDAEGHPIDGFLRLHEIYDLKLPVELVVLSACSTGLGKEVKGEGLVGLTRGFMYAGTPRVVASLWKVDDEATAELMANFYRGMLKGKLRPAAALRAAQIEMLNQPRWRSPYYWAAFVLQGEWR